jgi:hypothetical protein
VTAKVTTAPALTFRPMAPTAGDFERFAACFTDNGMPRSAGAVRWQFGENPTGKLWAEFAVQAESTPERLAAIYAVIPVRVRHPGGPRFAAQSVDTITDEAFRGRGLFLKLAKECYGRASIEKAAFVFGFPNGNSAHGFFKKLGWTSLDPVPFLIRPLRVRYVAEKLGIPSRFVPNLRVPVFTRRVPSGQRLVALDAWDERAAEVWSEFSRDVTIAVERDAAYLRWRLSRPGARYQSLGVFEGERLLAFGVYCVTEKHGGRVGYVIELLHRPDCAKAADAILGAMLGNMRSEGADVALAWNLRHSRNHRSFQKAGFFPLPERLRPIELHFGARSFDEPQNPAVTDRRSWYLSYCDSDTV